VKSRSGFSIILIIVPVALLLLGVLYLTISNKSNLDGFIGDTEKSSSRYFVYHSIPDQQYHSVDLETGSVYNLPNNNYQNGVNKLYYDNESGIWTQDYTGQNQVQLLATDQIDTELYCPLWHRIVSVSPNESNMLITKNSESNPYEECEVDGSQDYGYYLFNVKSKEETYIGPTENQEGAVYHFHDWEDPQTPAFLHKYMLMNTSQEGVLVESDNPDYLKLKQQKDNMPFSYDVSSDGKYALYLDDHGQASIDPLNPNRDLVLHNMQNNSETILVNNKFGPRYGFSPGGKRIAYTEGIDGIEPLIIYDIETGSKNRLKPDSNDYSFGTVFYWIDNRYLLSGGDNFSHYLVDTTSGSVKKVFENVSFIDNFSSKQQIDKLNNILGSN